MLRDYVFGRNDGSPLSDRRRSVTSDSGSAGPLSPLAATASSPTLQLAYNRILELPVQSVDHFRAKMNNLMMQYHNTTIEFDKEKRKKRDRKNRQCSPSANRQSSPLWHGSPFKGGSLSPRKVGTPVKSHFQAKTPPAARKSSLGDTVRTLSPASGRRRNSQGTLPLDEKEFTFSDIPLSQTVVLGSTHTRITTPKRTQEGLAMKTPPRQSTAQAAAAGSGRRTMGSSDSIRKSPSSSPIQLAGTPQVRSSNAVGATAAGHPPIPADLISNPDTEVVRGTLKRPPLSPSELRDLYKATHLARQPQRLTSDVLKDNSNLNSTVDDDFTPSELANHCRDCRRESSTKKFYKKEDMVRAERRAFYMGLPEEPEESKGMTPKERIQWYEQHRSKTPTPRRTTSPNSKPEAAARATPVKIATPRPARESASRPTAISPIPATKRAGDWDLYCSDPRLHSPSVARVAATSLKVAGTFPLKMPEEERGLTRKASIKRDSPKTPARRDEPLLLMRRK